MATPPTTINLLNGPIPASPIIVGQLPGDAEVNGNVRAEWARFFVSLWARTGGPHGTMSGAGTITGVTAGTGLAGGGTSGTVTVSLQTPVTIADGGTFATTAPQALANLGAAPIASPSFTGVPAAPTPAPGTNTTQVATTAFVAAAITGAGVPLPSSTLPSMDGAAAVGTGITYARADHVHPSDTSRYAASNPSGYVNAAGAATAAPVQSVATRTGAVTLTHTDITDWTATLAPYAPLASPTFTGTPSMPTGSTGITQTAGNNSTKLATTGYVDNAGALLWG